MNENHDELGRFASAGVTSKESARAIKATKEAHEREKQALERDTPSGYGAAESEHGIAQDWHDRAADKHNRMARWVKNTDDVKHFSLAQMHNEASTYHRLKREEFIVKYEDAKARGRTDSIVPGWRGTKARPIQIGKYTDDNKPGPYGNRGPYGN